MPEPVGDRARVNPSFHHKGTVLMPEVVQADPRQTETFESWIPVAPANAVLMERLALGPAEDEFVLVELRAQPDPFARFGCANVRILSLTAGSGALLRRNEPKTTSGVATDPPKTSCAMWGSKYGVADVKVAAWTTYAQLIAGGLQWSGGWLLGEGLCESQTPA